VDEADQQSVTPSQPVEDALDQEDCLPSQPTIEVAVDQDDPQSIVLTVQQQPDGTCIIALPDDFIGEAIVNITQGSNEVVSNRLNGEVSAWTDDQRAPATVVAEEERSDCDHNRDKMEENVDVTSPPSESRKRQRRSHTWQKNQLHTEGHFSAIPWC